MKSAMRTRIFMCAAGLALFTLAACEHKPTKEEEEAMKNTLACQLRDQRTVIRFDPGEARLLTATGESITLYQIPSTTGVRYSNGNLEIRGSGQDLTLIEYGVATKLSNCQPYSASKP